MQWSRRIWSCLMAGWFCLNFLFLNLLQDVQGILKQNHCCSFWNFHIFWTAHQNQEKEDIVLVLPSQFREVKLLLCLGLTMWNTLTFRHLECVILLFLVNVVVLISFGWLPTWDLLWNLSLLMWNKGLSFGFLYLVYFFNCSNFPIADAFKV